jgi:NAD(P)-dependent dehydrogenase (short-subunit alcohol dehydrogenase family)
VRERWGTLDVLVNNAGTEYPTPLADTAPDAMARWAGLLDNNVTSMVRLTQALLPLLPRGASIINQSSIWGRIGVAGFSAYAASKHAVIGLTRSLALELGPRGIRVNAVCPGWVRTAAALRSLSAMAQAQGRSEAEVEREILSKQAMPVMPTPEDLAGVFLFLASAGAAPLTGQCLVASHGEVMA